MAEESTNEPTEPKHDALDVPIGEIIRRNRQLSDKDIESIVEHQNVHGLRFGEAAVQLKLANREDILDALSQQFQYPYANKTESTSFSVEVVAGAQPFSDEAEYFRELRSNLILGAFSRMPVSNTIALASPDIGDGKSFIASNLALTFSQLGGRTLLLDADLRTPKQHKLFSLKSSPSGLSGILAGRKEDRQITQVPGFPSLYVLPAGAVPPNPLELLQSRSFAALVKELQSKFDYVVVDTPALRHGADVRVIASVCGLSLVVARKGTTKQRELNKLTTFLSNGGCRIAGVIVNDW